MFASAEVALKATQLITSPHELERTQANAYLCAFQESTEAWGICRELIQPSSDEIPMLFACQTLYVKIKADWHKLDNPQREELKLYIDSLLTLPLTPNAIKKICQCYAFIGMLMMATTWEGFISQVLQEKPFNIGLEVMDCVPYCVDEFCMSKRLSERIKSLISEQTQEILSYFNSLIVTKGCLWQVLEVIKGWKLLKLNIFSNPGLTQTLLTLLTDLSNPQYPSVCRILVDAINNCQSIYLFDGKATYKPGMTLEDTLNHYPPQEKDSILAFIQVISQVYTGILTHPDFEIKQAGTELIVGFALANQALFLWNDTLSFNIWQVMDGVIGSEDIEVAYSGLDFWCEFKDLLFKNIRDLGNMPWMFSHIIRHTGFIAKKAQYSSYEEFFASVSKDSEANLANYRSSAEEVFNSFFLLFEKYHPQKSIAFLQIVGQLLEKPVSVSNAEVFMLIMRSILISLVDIEAIPTLREILSAAFTLPDDPLVCKAVIFFINDIGVNFKQIPDTFGLALDYVIKAGFYSPNRVNFFLDSNAIECLLNFCTDCISLFDTDMIVSTIDIGTAALPQLKTCYADKLVQALLKIATRLPAETYALKLTQIMKVASDDAFKLAPALTDSAETKKLVGKTILIWGAALNSLDSADMQFMTKVLAEPIRSTVSLSTRALSAYINDEGIVLAVSNLFKRLIKALKTDADSLFPEIVTSCLTNYRPPYESLLSVITIAVAELANAPITNGWLQANYPSLLSSLIAHLNVSSDPDLVSSFFDLHSKLVETYQLELLNPQVINQLINTTSAALRSVTNRNPCNSVQYFAILLYSLDSLRDQLAPYVSQLIYSVLLGLDKLHSTTLHQTASLIGILRAYSEEFQQGVVLALNSEAFSKLSQSQKGIVHKCLIGLPSKPISSLKQLSLDLSKILRGYATPDVLIASEIALGGFINKSKEPKVIDLTK